MRKADEPLVLKRVYRVAPEKVWGAWIDERALRTWLGQDDSPAWAADLDLRVGGRYRFVLREPGGNTYEARGVYREVVPHRRLAFTWSWRDGTAEDEAMITVQFAPVAGGTEQVFTLDPVMDPRERDAWRADFKRLGLLLEEK
jgi:uncharacterized protein YndB with AHSA1/START domain